MKTTVKVLKGKGWKDAQVQIALKAFAKDGRLLAFGEGLAQDKDHFSRFNASVKRFRLLGLSGREVDYAAAALTEATLAIIKDLKDAQVN